VIQCIEAHGNSRFELISKASRGDRDDRAGDQRVTNRLGFRQYDLAGHLQYLVLSKSWASEVCKGHDAKLIARTLHERGHLQVDLGRTKGRYSDMIRIPGHGPVRVYVLNSSILGGSQQIPHEAGDVAQPTPDLLVH
jgi:hypothetical protein